MCLLIVICVCGFVCYGTVWWFGFRIGGLNIRVCMILVFDFEFVCLDLSLIVLVFCCCFVVWLFLYLCGLVCW